MDAGGNFDANTALTNYTLALVKFNNVVSPSNNLPESYGTLLHFEFAGLAGQIYIGGQTSNVYGRGKFISWSSWKTLS